MMSFERTTNNKMVSVTNGSRSSDFWLRAITITMLVISFGWLPSCWLTSMVYGEEGYLLKTTGLEYLLAVDDKGTIIVSDDKLQPFERSEELIPLLDQIKDFFERSNEEVQRVAVIAKGSITIVDCGFNEHSVWECKKYVF